MRRRRLFKTAGVFLALLAVRCSGCRSRAPIEKVPASSVVVVEVPSVAQLVVNGRALFHKIVDSAPLRGLLSARADDAVQAVVGVDLTERRAVIKTGIDPRQGAVLSVDADGRASAVFVVRDRALVGDFLRQLARKHLGKPVFGKSTSSAVEVTTVTRRRGGPPLFAWAVQDKHLVIGADLARRGRAMGAVSRVLSATNSVTDNPTFREVRAQMTKTDAWVFIDGAGARRVFETQTRARIERAPPARRDELRRATREDVEITRGALASVDGVGIGWLGEGTRVGLRGFVKLAKDNAKLVERLLTGRGEAHRFGRLIQADAMSLFRASINLKLAWDKLLERLPTDDRRRLYTAIGRWQRRNGLSLEKSVLAALSGRFAGATYAPTAKHLGPTQALLKMEFALFAEVSDEKRAAELLVRAERLLVMQRLSVRVRSEHGRRVYTLEKLGKPAASWTIVNRLLVIASPARFKQALTMVDKGGDNILGVIESRQAKGLLKTDDRAILMHCRVGQLVKLARRVDFGGALRMALSGALAAVEKTSDVTATVEADDDGVSFSATFGLAD